MARKVSKAGKGGGEALAAVEDILTAVSEAVSGTKFDVKATVEQKAFNQYTQNMKKELTKAYVKAATEIENQLASAMLDNIETPMWPWPRPTRRVSGGVAGSPRDIVDTQDLQDRNKVSVKYNVKGFVATITNNAPYSGIVHYGGYVGFGGKTYVPGRPWISVSLGLKAQRGGGAPSLPSGGGATVVDYRSIISDAVTAAIARASEGLN